MAIETRLLVMTNLMSHISLPDNPKTINHKIFPNKPGIAKCDETSKPQKYMYMYILIKEKFPNIHTVYVHTIYKL